MKVSHRLYLTVLPAVLALILLAALAYWGKYEHSVPEAFVVVATVGTVASFILAWRNARYIAVRIEKLAGTRAPLLGRNSPPTGGPATRDELTVIERDVDLLVEELTATRLREDELKLRVAAERARAIDILTKASESATASIESARMPLHILLENRFGELNENQEEMLGAAQVAADEAAILLRRVRLAADLESGRALPRRDALRLDDAVESAVAPLRAQASQRAVTIHIAMEPALPRVLSDRGLIHDLLTLLIRDVVLQSTSPGSVAVSAARTGGGATILLRIEGKWDEAVRLDVMLATSISAAVGAKLERTPQLITLEFPTSSASAAPAAPAAMAAPAAPDPPQ